MTRAGPIMALLGALALVWTTAEAGPPPWAPAHGYRATQGGPPDHAPAHGWRARRGQPQAPQVEVYAPQDLGIDLGVCERDVIERVLEGVLEGVLGTGIGRPARTPEDMAGVIAEVLIGGAIGRSMDATDQLCIAQALEAAADGQQVRWTGTGGTAYRLEPVHSFRDAAGRPCREYVIEAEGQGFYERRLGLACRADHGGWLPA
jgi:surface antigen